MLERLGKMVVGSDMSGQPVTADDLGITGAIVALMRDALKPSMLQTLEVWAHSVPVLTTSFTARHVFHHVVNR